MKKLVSARIKRVSTIRLLSVGLMLSALAGIGLTVGCEETSTEPNGTGSIGMTSDYSSAVASASLDAPFRVVGGARSTAIDSVRITRARFVLRDIKYKTQNDSSMFRATPFVLELGLSSALQEISVVSVPFGSYRRVEYDVHRININDVIVLPISEQAQFAEFLVDERYSIIISGFTYTAGQDSAFTFRSRLNVKQKIDLSPELVVSETTPPVNATMLISSGGWFLNSSGALLDPNDVQNENAISENIRASIKVFKDNNKDGSTDAL